jgi:putative transposase
MRRSGFAEEPINGLLKEPVVAVADLCRKHGGSGDSTRMWKARLSGMGVSEAKQKRMLPMRCASISR